MENKSTLFKVILCILAAVILLLSFTVVTKYTTNPENHKQSIQILDEKKENVMKLTALTTASSTALTLIPGDVATPIADKLADMSTYFLIILCAIFLEKYLLTITGYAAFRVLIPLGMAALIAWAVFNKSFLRNLAIRLAICGALLYAAVPVGITVSHMVEETYATSLQTTIEEAEVLNEELEEETGSGTEEVQEETAGEEMAEEESSGIGLFSIGNIKESLTDGISSIVNMGEDKANELAEKAEATLNRFIEATAVMLITSCVIPILVMLFFFWLMKVAVGVTFDFRPRADFMRQIS